ncbi:MAG: MBL fold metallo-hydrolase [Anaerolineae bacterium]|nr:MBL fold metallo-hydrolase [Anaerolineae bacterium]
MSKLAQKIRTTRVEPGSVAIFWLAQAGFVFKTPDDKIIYIDPYLSDYAHRLLANEQYGFKRIMMSPIEPEEVEADCVICTHSHADHFDVDAIPTLAQNPRIHFITAPDCRVEFEKLNIPAGKYTIIQKDQTVVMDGDYHVTGVFADHGELAPDALGMIITVGDVKIWQVGDTAYRPEMWQDVFQMGIDVIIPPINGAYGNLDGIAAAKLAADANAKVAIPCHFWLFAEHNGNPAQFMDACQQFAPQVKPLLMTQGEMFVYHKER